MNGAIFFSGKYGSTEQYANWISEETGFPVFSIDNTNADPANYDYLILGSSIIYFKLTIRKWINSNISKLKHRSIVFFSVSGAGPSAKLERWVSNSLHPALALKIKHVALRGKLDHTKVSWWVRKILWMGSLFNRDPKARKDEQYGFNYMDKDSIKPILKFIDHLKQQQAAVYQSI